MSGEELPNSIIHLLSTLITMETSWPMLIQSELALPRQVLSLGFFRQTSIGLREQDLSCPLSPTHQWWGAVHCSPDCTLCHVTQLEEREP